MQIHYASQRVHTANPFAMDVGGTTAAAATSIAGPGGLLAQAGWSQTSGGAKATAVFSFPFGITGWAGLGVWICEIDGIWFEAIPAGPPGPTLSGSVCSVPVVMSGSSVNQAASMAALAAAIQLFTQWDAAIGGSYTLTLTAKIAGTAANYSAMDYNGAQCVLMSGPSGGAWQWISASGLYGAQLAVTLVAEPVPGYAYANLQIDVLYPGGTTYTWTLGCRARYQFWANEYSLAFWVDPVDDVVEPLSGGVAAYDSFFYAGIPRQCDLVYEFTPTAGSAFSHWDPARTLVANYNPGVDVLNGSYGAFTGLNFALAVPVSSGYEIDAKCAVDPVSSSPPGPAMAIPARLGLPGAISAPPNSVFVVGWLYDGMVVTAEYPLGSQVPYDGYTWIAMLAQPGATLFLCLAPLPGLGSAFTCNARAGARF